VLKSEIRYFARAGTLVKKYVLLNANALYLRPLAMSPGAITEMLIAAPLTLFCIAVQAAQHTVF
jgi:hypothetical protein